MQNFGRHISRKRTTWRRRRQCSGGCDYVVNRVFHLPTDALHTSLSFTNRCTSYQSFIYQQMHFISVLENIKIHIKTYIKIAPTCFGLRPSSGSLHMSLAKVTFIKSVKVRRYGLCRCGAACCHTTATLMISGCTVQR